jgi:hypothetical protein
LLLHQGIVDGGRGRLGIGLLSDGRQSKEEEEQEEEEKESWGESLQALHRATLTRLAVPRVETEE